MNNNNGYTVFDTSPKRTAAEAMAKYDALPADLRQVLRDAPYNLAIKDGMTRIFTANSLRNTIQYSMREAALKTYGKNYPRLQFTS